MKILLIRLDHLGDLVLTTPLIRALARAGHAVDVVTLRWLGAVLEGNPYVKEVFAIEDIAEGFPLGWRRLSKWMRARKYDCILLPNPRPHQLLWASAFSGARYRLAMQAKFLGRLTAHRCLRVREGFMAGRHFADLQLDLARSLQIPTDGIKPDYFCREDEVVQARKHLGTIFPENPREPLIGIHPGSLGNTCNLPSSIYGELAARVLERTNWNLIITGSSKEVALLDSWPKAVLDSPRVYQSMGAFDLRGLAAVISLLANYVIVGTGPLHVAAALGIPTTSPFCAIPPLTDSCWGNAAGLGVAVRPSAANCRAWCSQGRPVCDFRGEISAEDLWQALSQRKSIQH